jgi:hypothetical protein
LNWHERRAKAIGSLAMCVIDVTLIRTRRRERFSAAVTLSARQSIDDFLRNQHPPIDDDVGLVNVNASNRGSTTVVLV